MAIVTLPAKEKYLVGETSENLVLSRNRYLERESRITYLELGKKKPVVENGEKPQRQIYLRI